jgi:hypothetical protein
MDLHVSVSEQNGSWIVGTGRFISHWSNGEYILPCLSDECRILCPLTHQFSGLSQDSWFEITSETEKWFINDNYFKYQGGEYPLLFFKRSEIGNTIKKGQVYSVNVEDISSEGDYKSNGGYIEIAVNRSGKTQSLPIIRINQSPTLYIKVRLERFIRDLGRLVIQKHSESELQDRYLDKNAWGKEDCPFHRFESIWIRRENLKQYRYDQRDFSDLILCGDLGHAIHKTVAFAFHEGILECTNNHIFKDFAFFFSETMDLLWAGGGTGGSCHLTEHDAARSMFAFRFHALEFMDDPLITFFSRNLDELAEKAWEYAFTREGKDLGSDRGCALQNKSQMTGYNFDLPPSRRLMMDEMLKRLDTEKTLFWQNIGAEHDTE